MNISELKNRVANAVADYNKEFMATHDEPDFGECGSAVVLISFGRKRKIKEAFLDEVLLGIDWSSASKKTFVFEYDGNAGVPVPTQYAGYYRQRAYLVSRILKEWLAENGQEGIDVHVHSWID